MPNFISWPCPSCGAALDVAEEVSRVTCGACGNEHDVKRTGGKVTLITMREITQKIHEGFDKAESEAALAKLKLNKKD